MQRQEIGRLRVCPIRGRIDLDKGKRGLAPGPEKNVKLGENRVGRVPVPVFRAIGAMAGMRLDTLMGQTLRFRFLWSALGIR